jgi:hypothetical protein
MNCHIIKVEKENRNQINHDHDHDNIDDHNHEDTYWEHFLETKDEITTNDTVNNTPLCIETTQSNVTLPLESPPSGGDVNKQTLPGAKHPSELVMKRLEAPCHTNAYIFFVYYRYLNIFFLNFQSESRLSLCII